VERHSDLTAGEAAQELQPRSGKRFHRREAAQDFTPAKRQKRINSREAAKE